MVLSKEVRDNNLPNDNIWFVTDSHHSLLLQFHATNGVKCSAIRGGRILHTRKLLENCRSNCVVILAGGNDLVDCDPVLVVQETMRLVRDIVRRDGAKCIITGSVIPRAARDFVGKAREFDLMIEQGDLTHHHFETDLFIDGTGIQSASLRTGY